MKMGTIKHFNVSRGFGFVTPDQPGLLDQFFHLYDCQIAAQDASRLLLPGTRVSFEMGQGRDGRERAVDVRVLEVTMTDLHGNAAPVGRYSGFVDE